jgi:hypothetical protein
MSSSNAHDVILLGGAAPGEHCAAALAVRGLKVAVVERELVGGECSYWACIPSKSLLRPREAVLGALEGEATAEVDVQAASRGAISWCPITPTPARRGGWWTAASTCSVAPAGSPAPAWSESTASATGRSTSSWLPDRIRSFLRSRDCVSWMASGARARFPMLLSDDERLTGADALKGGQDLVG